MTNGPVLEADMLMVRNRRLMGRETMAPSSLYRKDGSIIGSFESLYVVTKEQGRWGVKLRSSMAP